MYCETAPYRWVRQVAVVFYQSQRVSGSSFCLYTFHPSKRMLPSAITLLVDNSLALILTVQSQLARPSPFLTSLAHWPGLLLWLSLISPDSLRLQSDGLQLHPLGQQLTVVLGLLWGLLSLLANIYKRAEKHWMQLAGTFKVECFF